MKGIEFMFDVVGISLYTTISFAGFYYASGKRFEKYNKLIDVSQLRAATANIGFAIFILCHCMFGFSMLFDTGAMLLFDAIFLTMGLIMMMLNVPKTIRIIKERHQYQHDKALKDGFDTLLCGLNERYGKDDKL